MSFKCSACGFTESVRQMRQVKVTVGWTMAEFCSVVPCVMCTRCGLAGCPVDVTVGAFIDMAVPMDAPLEPPPAAAAQGSNPPGNSEEQEGGGVDPNPPIPLRRRKDK